MRGNNKHAPDIIRFQDHNFFFIFAGMHAAAKQGFAIRSEGDDFCRPGTMRHAKFNPVHAAGELNIQLHATVQAGITGNLSKSGLGIKPAAMIKYGE